MVKQYYNNLKRKTAPASRMRSLGDSMASARKRQVTYSSRVSAAKKAGTQIMSRFDSRNNPRRLDRTTSFQSSPAVYNIGRAHTDHSNKTNVVENERSARPSETLLQIDTTFIPRNVGNNLINQRDRDTILMKGVRIDALFLNKTTNPMYIRCALVNRKNGATPSTTDFFRGYGDERSADFNSGGNSAHLVKRSDPINADEYNIFKSWQFTLSPSSAETNIGYNSSDAGNWHDLSDYVAINRYLNYDGPGSTTCTERVFFVYWATLAYTQQTSPPVAGAMDVQSRIITFFNDGSNL